MTTRAFFFWLLLFFSGSVLWIFATGSMWLVGCVLIAVAVFLANSPRTRRRQPLHVGRPRVAAALIFLNIVPMFVAGWDINRQSRSAVLTTVYVIVACAVVTSNAYRTFSVVESHAA